MCKVAVGGGLADVFATCWPTDPVLQPWPTCCSPGLRVGLQTLYCSPGPTEKESAVDERADGGPVLQLPLVRAQSVYACVHGRHGPARRRHVSMLLAVCTVLPARTQSSTSARASEMRSYPNAGWTRILHFWLRPSVNRRAGSRTCSAPLVSSIAHTGPGLGLGWRMRSERDKFPPAFE